MDYEKYDIIIVGCGLSGISMAEQFSRLQNKKILIIDKRDHIGGNCYDYYDEKTNILMNKYGAHLFHTNDEEVFEYINQYGNWCHWEHKVLGLIDDKHLPIPVNITTVNEIFNFDIKNKEEMDEWLSENQTKYENITNGEEMAKSRVGEVLYKKIFKDYTYKQWKKYPDELAPEVLARIPVRNSFDDRYFSDKYQVLPEKGYTAFFESILNKHKHNIDVKLNFDFFDIKDEIKKDQIIIYTGPIDAYFADKGLPKLEYRSIDFHIERKMNTDFYQPYSVVNYPNADTPYTRCVEYKHFLNQKSDHTVYVKETTTDTGEPYYPVLNDKNKELYKKYQTMAEEEGKNIHFLGRLASYKYFNMDQAIKNSLNYFKQNFSKKKECTYLSKNNKNGIRIFSVFCGRERYMKILSMYIDRLLQLNTIDEVHLWDFIKNENDRAYINNLCKKEKYFLKKPDNSTGGKWDGYYNYYSKNLNNNDILIKCDDDIVYIDVETFEDYLSSVKNGSFYYPNIVNNDVCAFYQQKYNVHNLFDYTENLKNWSKKLQLINDYATPLTGGFGKKTKGWFESFEKASKCHKMFLENPDRFKLYSKPLENYASRISINMFACTGVTAKKHFIKVITGDNNNRFRGNDEMIISGKSKAGNIINLNNTIVHFQFGPQNGKVLDKLFLNKYYTLAIKNLFDYKEHCEFNITNSNDFSVSNSYFDVFKIKGILYFIDYGGYESRNKSTIWCIKEANKFYKWNDFYKIRIYTGDYETNQQNYTYSNQINLSKTIPDFNFHSWPEVGIDDYEKFINKIDICGLKKAEINKVGWIGNIDTNYKRKIAYNISLKYSDYIEMIPMKWLKSNNIKLNSTNYISTPELVSKYAILIDIEGRGYSGRTKHLLWSHRPLIIVDRKHKEYFYKYLKPWIHYIPVKSDLSDLIKIVKWCLENENHAKKIAENAYQFSTKYLTRQSCYYRWNQIINNEIKIQESEASKEFYFYIRGHIRNSFKTDRLKNFVKLLKKKFPNIIFILQTWKHQECKNGESWRNILENKTIIFKSTIDKYFGDPDITKNCLIIDEETIKLVGSTIGTICNHKCSRKGWKNMWYGKYKGIEHLNLNQDNILVSFRYDYFDLPQSNKINENEIIIFINNNLNTSNIKFIKYMDEGTDNLYMGSLKKIKPLIEKFHFKLDNILNMNKKIFHQEYLVNIVAKEFNDKKNIDNLKYINELIYMKLLTIYTKNLIFLIILYLKVLIIFYLKALLLIQIQMF